ncbi:helix-turn-helix domain-containing protein [Nucisporomicrobium flavum]|uniref:helix-turn-helix domain-containing protein n=1 Tax=Nucisporomicrobium flavum TaxID=2785915 RepID=UPI0035586814
MAAVALAVAQARRSAGMTVEEVAAASGLTRRALTFIEGGHRLPTLPSLYAIAHAVGVPLGQLAEAGDPLSR